MIDLKRVYAAPTEDIAISELEKFTTYLINSKQLFTLWTQENLCSLKIHNVFDSFKMLTTNSCFTFYDNIVNRFAIFRLPSK
jgi:hypothetical protein